MSGLRSDYLKDLSNLCLSDFSDVVPCDKLSVLTQGDKYICNLDPSNEKGSHYIAVSIKKDYCLYFDSYGFPCMNEYIKKAFLENDITTLYYSKKSIQSSFSLFCGYFSLAFLICDECGLSMDEFQNLFDDKNLKRNEKVAADIIKISIAKFNM